MFVLVLGSSVRNRDACVLSYSSNSDILTLQFVENLQKMANISKPHF